VLNVRFSFQVASSFAIATLFLLPYPKWSSDIQVAEVVSVEIGLSERCPIPVLSRKRGFFTRDGTRAQPIGLVWASS